MRTLIVEDNATSRIVLQKMLSQHSECDSVATSRGAVDAVERSFAQQAPYDLVCLDIQLPDMRGHAVLGQLRDIEEERGGRGLEAVKVVMTTSLKDAKNVIRSTGRS